MTPRLAFFVATLILVVVACDSANTRPLNDPLTSAAETTLPNGSTTPQSETAPTRTTGTSLDAPTDQIGRAVEVARILGSSDEQSIADGLLIAEAEAELIYLCTLAQGMDWRPPSPSPMRSSSTVVSLSRFDWWSHDGDTFGISEALQDQQLLSSLRATLEPAAVEYPDGPTPPAGYNEVLYGDPPEYFTVKWDNGTVVQVPSGGCVGETSLSLFGVSAEEYERARVAQPSSGELFSLVYSDPLVTSSISSWSECMSSAGIEVESPHFLPGLFGGHIEGFLEGTESLPDLERFETLVASQDAICKAESGLLPAFVEAWASIGQQLIDDHEGVLVLFSEMQNHAVVVAQQLLTGNGP